MKFFNEQFEIKNSFISIEMSEAGRHSMWFNPLYNSKLLVDVYNYPLKQPNSNVLYNLDTSDNGDYKIFLKELYE